MKIPFFNRSKKIVSEPIRLKPVMPVVTAEMGQAIRKMNALVEGFNKATGEVAERFNRAYLSAVTDDYNRDLPGTYGSANSEMLQSDYVSRARARTVTKDKSYGRAIERAMMNNVVGHEGFKLEMKIVQKQKIKNKKAIQPDGTLDPDEPEMRDKEVIDTDRCTWIEEAWKDFCKKTNFTIGKNMCSTEAYQMVEASRFRDGNVICRMHFGYPYNEFGFALDFLEWDRLMSAYQGMDDEGNPIRWSISYHPRWKFPIYYWILTRHPGEVFGIIGYVPQNSSGANEWYREKVPASEIVAFCNPRYRAEQDIGMTEVTPTLMPIWRSEQFKKAHQLASIASAAKPYWIEKDFTGLILPEQSKEQVSNTPGLDGDFPPDKAGNENDGSETIARQLDSGATVETVKPAARETFPPGFKLKQADPKFPIENAAELLKSLCEEMAIGSGVSYTDVSGQFQNMGFIAGLMSQIPARETYKFRQKTFIADVEIIFRNWLKSTILTGYFDKRDQDIPMSRLDEFCRAAHFKGKRWPMVNPLVEAQALIILNEAGHLTRQQVQDRMEDGLSFNKLVQAFENEKDDIGEHGLNWSDVDVTRPTISKGEPGQGVPSPAAGGEAQPPAKTKVANPVRSRFGQLSERSKTLIAQALKVEMDKMADDAISGNGTH